MPRPLPPSVCVSLLVALFVGCAPGVAPRGDGQGDGSDMSGQGDADDQDPGDPADAGGDPASCQTVPNEGCGDDAACDRRADGPFQCRPFVAGARTQTECAVLDDCDRGYTCVGFPDSPAHCKRYCASDADCEAGLCSEQLANGAGLCSDACEPPSGDGCPAGWRCYLVSVGADTATTCRYDTAALEEGASCDPADRFACKAGMDCIQQGDAGYCRTFCRLGDPVTACAVGTCTDVGYPALITGDRYGLCL